MVSQENRATNVPCLAIPYEAICPNAKVFYALTTVLTCQIRTPLPPIWVRIEYYTDMVVCGL